VVTNGPQSQQSVAVLYFDDLGGRAEDQYFRDGITEDIITELSKIKGLKIYSRATVLAYRDKAVTPQAIGQQINAAYVLTGSLRRAGARLRINAQLVDTHTDFPLWSERYDREMKDVFEVQDEIARKIAEALRITLSPQEVQALAAKPTDDLHAYDLYLRGKSYARRLTRQDLDFALQMFESAVAIDPNFALAHAAIANASIFCYVNFERDQRWLDRASAAVKRAVALSPDAPEVQVAEGWILYPDGKYEEAAKQARAAIEKKADCDGAYVLLGRALFAAGRHQEILQMSDAAIAASGNDYNTYVPIMNAMGALAKTEAHRNMAVQRAQVLQAHLTEVPEDARARTLLAGDYADLGRPDDAAREANMAITLRPNDALIAYNSACVFCSLNRKDEAIKALRKAWESGFRDSDWARNDPDLNALHNEPEFDRMFPRV